MRHIKGAGGSLSAVKRTRVCDFDLNPKASLLGKLQIETESSRLYHIGLDYLDYLPF